MRRPKIKQPDGTSMRTIEQKRDIKQTDKTILDNFYKLVNRESHVRLTAALSTFKILNAMKKTNITKFNEHLNYCVERLVTGLASPRALARRGYATLLMEILIHHQFSTDRLLSIAQKKFGSIPQESIDNLVGYYLLVTIILESGNWNKWKTNREKEYSEKMYKLLCQLRNRKSYFDLPVNKLLVRYHDVFRSFMGNEDILDRLADPPISMLGKHAHTKLTEIIFKDCSPDTLEAYLGKLIDTFSRKHTPESRKVYAFCAKQMAQLVRRMPSDLDPNSEVINRHETTIRLGKFLIANTLFSSVNSSKVPKSIWDRHRVVVGPDPLHISTNKALKAAYHATLDHVVSTCHAKVRLDIMREFVDFADVLIKCQAVSFTAQSSKTAQLWSKYMEYLESHTALSIKRKDSSILFPITSLHLLYGLQVLEHSLDCKEQLADLAKSATEALKDDPNDGTWADVLTDQIIAILSATECNPWIRRLCVSVFGSLLPHISETSIDLICDVFKAPVGGADDGDEDEDDPSSEDADDSSDRMEVDDSEVSEEDSASDDVSDEEDRLPLCAPGEQGDEEEEGEEGEEYLDDEQMMKLDSVLAEMFRMNRVGGKKKDPSFQLRCLDLVKKIIHKKHSDGELIRKIRATIVPFANKCRRHKETRAIAEKVSKMLANK